MRSYLQFWAKAGKRGCGMTSYEKIRKTWRKENENISLVNDSRSERGTKYVCVCVCVYKRYLYLEQFDTMQMMRKEKILGFFRGRRLMRFDTPSSSRLISSSCSGFLRGFPVMQASWPFDCFSFSSALEYLLLQDEIFVSSLNIERSIIGGRIKMTVWPQEHNQGGGC